MKIFWCWQSDTDQNACRHFIKAALQAAIDEIAASPELEERPEIDHDTKDIAGMPDIVATIFEKIDAASVIVADMTTVARTDAGKAAANPNVLVEVGYAKKSVGATKIICVANTHWFAGPDDLPFDLRNRRGPIQYCLPPDCSSEERKKVRASLTKQLKEALLLILKDGPRPATSGDPHGRPSRQGDPSIWLAKDAKMVTSGGVRTSIIPYEGPRAYVRVFTNGWNSEPPQRSRLRELLTNDAFWAPAVTTVGDHGLNEDGSLKYWFKENAREPVAWSATQFFLSTAEIWTYVGGILTDFENISFLNVAGVCSAWREAIAKDIAFLDLVAARRPFGVELGVHGLSHLYWPGGLERITALQENISVRRTSNVGAELGPEALEAGIAALADVYALPRSAIA